MEFEKFKKLRGMAHSLEEYAQLQNDELGEVCLVLADLTNRLDYVSPAFAEAVYTEVVKTLNMFRKRTAVIKTKTTTSEPQTHKVLEWY